MFNECFLCGISFGYDAMEKKQLHTLGKHLICHRCLAELKDALKAETVEGSADGLQLNLTEDISAILDNN